MVEFIARHRFPLIAGALLSLTVFSACASNDNAHTTVTTIVPPPTRQVLTTVAIPKSPTPSDKQGDAPAILNTIINRPGVDPSKPLLILKTPEENQVLRLGEVVVVDFSVSNARLKDDGGEFRIRYFVDDDDPQWVDSATSFGLKGWLPGKHRIRVELVGPDGWPFRNGDQNIITRDFTVSET